MTGIVAVYAIFSSHEEAERIGRAMIERRHAACVNILGTCHSIYRWQGAIEQAQEVATLFKTSEAGADALIGANAGLHSYDNPAIAAWPVTHAPMAYAAWLEEETR